MKLQPRKIKQLVKLQSQIRNLMADENVGLLGVTEDFIQLDRSVMADLVQRYHYRIEKPKDYSDHYEVKVVIAGSNFISIGKASDWAAVGFYINTEQFK